MANTIKELLGDSYRADMTIEQAEIELGNKGIKLADLSKGGYVSKEKHERLQNDYDNEIANSKKYHEETKDYEELKNFKVNAERETKENGIKAQLKKAGWKDEYLELGLYEISKGNIKEGDEFESSVKEFLGKNPTYGTAVDGQGGNPNPADPKPATINTNINNGNNPNTGPQLPKQVDVKPWNQNRS